MNAASCFFSPYMRTHTDGNWTEAQIHFYLVFTLERPYPDSRYHRLCQALVPSYPPTAPHLTRAFNEQQHYVGGGGCTAYSSNQDDRSCHELHLWLFAESVKVSMGSIICIYNRANQTHSCENRGDILEDELKFQVSGSFLRVFMVGWE